MDQITELQLVETDQLVFFDFLGKEEQATFVRESILNPPPPSNYSRRPFKADLVDHILDSPNRKFLLKESFDCVYENKDKFHYSQGDWSGYHNKLLSSIDDWVNYITLRDPYGSVEAAVSGDDFNITLEKIGMIVDKNSLPWVTENLIRAMASKEEDPIVKEKLLKVGKVLIGLEPDDSRDFRLSLNELYKNISFEKYPTNLEANKEDLKMIGKVIQPTDEVLIDMGCGTGRLANKIADRFLGIKVIGVDPSKENLDKAEKSDVTKRVHYEVGSMESPNLAKDSADVIIVLGRTFPHLRDYGEIADAFKNFNRILKDGGRVLFDVPNPNTGMYLENRKKYLNILKSLKIPIQATSDPLRHFYRVVDSPDGGKSLYDRYIPDWNGDDLVQTGLGAGKKFKDAVGNQTGFDISELEKMGVSGWGGSESIYFEAVKKNSLPSV